jgi:hypothetical protein
MAHHYRPGMKMYQVIWERDGERGYTCALFAEDEADARSRAERVHVITFPLSLSDDY